MTKDQITRWATQARLPHDYEKQLPMWFDQLSEFADLVATHERLACAKVVDDCEKRYEERSNAPKNVRDIDPETGRIAAMTCFNVAIKIRNRVQK